MNFEFLVLSSRKFYALANDDAGHGGFLVSGKDGDHLPTHKHGKPDHHLMGAAWAALHGGYRGSKYEGPDKEKAIAKLKALYKTEGIPLPNALDELIFAQRDGDSWMIPLPNDSGIDDDGWALIAPFGRHPKTRIYKDGQQIKTQKFIQVLDNEAAEALIGKENSLFGRMKRALVGIPVFKDHGDLTDHDPQALGNVQKIKLGVVDQVRKSEKGVEAHFALDNEGAAAVENGCKFPSAFWLVLPNGNEGDAIVAKPFKLLSVALTQFPNISGVESLANARVALESQHQPIEKKNDMKKIAGFLLAMGATSLANNADPSEDQVLAAVQTIMTGRDQTVTALGNDKTTLNGTISTLTADRDGHKKRADDATTALANEQTQVKTERKRAASAAVDLAIFKGKLTPAKRDEQITALENSKNFDEDAKKLLEGSNVVRLATDTQSGKQSAALSNDDQQLVSDYQKAFDKELTKDQNPSAAHKRVMTMSEYAGIAQKLVPKAA